ncbi:UNVERIFIED_CONTAM: hypothetical protein PYX00_010269 [Menopon gallinae]|uniref:Inositol hexakisphosphate and diphosphoinositol-pentakisphosphate kinase n=1 Tax=Menopon gallinae TaxID=328185 RepID=A0AAW2HEQ1_9NEOP
MSYTELEHGYQDLQRLPSELFIGLDLESRLRSQNVSGDVSDDEVGNEEGKQVVVGICAMGKKSQSKPMKEILTRLEEFEYLKMLVFQEETILKKPVEEWPICDCLISFHSKGFPLDKAMQYANLRNPFIINNLDMQYDIQDRRKVYALLEREGIEIPRYAVLDRDSPSSKQDELIESEDHVEVNGVIFNKPFVEKPVSAEDHNIYIYYPTSAGGGSQRLFRKIGSRSSVYSPESRVRKTGSFIYEDFMPTDGTDVKVYTVGPDYAHAEARKSPALDGKVERDSEGKEIRYPVILSNQEKLISRKVCLAFKQTVCGFDLLRANGKSFVCDVNGFSFVKNSNKYYDDCAKILGNMILRELAPTLDIPWSVPFQLDDPPIVPTTFGKMMELRCVVAVIRHGDRTPKQKMKVEVRHPKFFEIFEKYNGYKNGHVKLKRPKQLQEILDIARSLLSEIQHSTADPEIEEKQGKLEQLKSVLEMYGHFSGINRKVQMKYQPKGRPRGSSSDDDAPKEPSLVLILKWGGELTPAGRIQAEELGRIFRCMYPGGQGRHINNGEYAGTQGLGLLRLHSTYRHDLKIYASDEGRVQMTAAAFAKGLLALEGELTPILFQMVKSANTNGLLDNDCDSSKYQNMAKSRLHELMQQDREFTAEDRQLINPCNAISISLALDFVKNPVKCCERVQELIQKLMAIVKTKRDDPKTKDSILYHGETWELMGRRWGKIDKDFCTKNKTYDISKIPDIYDCIKYDLQHNQHTLQFEQAEELYTYAKYLADIVIPQEYGLSVQEKLAIGQGICTPLLKKIRADLQRNIEECGEESVNRLNPHYSHGVSSPGRHVRTRLYFTSESHVHSLLTVFRFGELLDTKKDEQWKRAMEYVSMVSELNYMSQIVIMLYEDPTKDPTSDERFHVELHFSPGVNCCVQKNLPPGPGFRPHSRNESNTASLGPSCEHSTEDLTMLDPNSNIPVGLSRRMAISEAPEHVNRDNIPDVILLDSNTSTESFVENQGSESNDRYYTKRHRQEADIRPEVLQEETEVKPGTSELPSQLKPVMKRDAQDFIKPSEPIPIKTKEGAIYQSLDEVRKDVCSVECIDPGLNVAPAIASRSADSVDNFGASENPRNFPAGGEFPHGSRFPPSSPPIFVPKTVPLYLESTNDILPESPSWKYFQISPDRNTFTFPEVTFSNLIAVQAKNLNKEVAGSSSELCEDPSETAPKPKGKSGSIPADFVYSDGAFSRNNPEEYNGRFRGRSPMLSSEESIVAISESPECRKGFEGDADSSDGCARSVRARSTVTDQSKLFASVEKKRGDSDFPKVVITDPNACSIPHVSVEETPKSKLSSLNHSASSPSLPSKNTHPYHQCKKPGPVVHTEPPRRHRHSVAGHHNFKQNLSYFKLYGISVGPTGVIFNQSDRTKNKLLGSTSSLFSTAVISGSSSAPNLRDGISNNTTVSAIEGCGGVPPIRPLETLHNALSLKQLDLFLEKMTSAPLYRTPCNTPPQLPSTPKASSHPLGNVYWSGASSLVSSSGPSSPNTPSALNDLTRCHQGDMIINFSEDKYDYLRKISSSGSLACLFPQTPGLDEDLGSVGILLESGVGGQDQYPNSPEIDYTQLCAAGESEGIDPEACAASQNAGPDSGELTPVSVSSEFEYHHQQESDHPDHAASSKTPPTEVPCSSKQRETEIRLKEFFNLSEMNESQLLDTFNSEMIKKKFDGKLNPLETEEEDGEKTITTVASAMRESIVGFFSEETNSTNERKSSSDGAVPLK